MTSTGFWRPKSARMYLAFNFALCIAGNAFMRNSLNTAMICMVNSTLTTSSSSTGNDANSSDCSQSQSNTDYGGSFNWNSNKQGLMFCALFFGAFIGAMPAGWLADRHDAKMTISVGFIAMTAACLLLPITANAIGYIGVFILRFIMGIAGQAIVITCIGAIMARWIPPNERSTVIAVYTSGSQIAFIVGQPMNALLCTTKIGWESIFYVNGLFGIVCSIVWIVFGSNQPENYKFISKDEKQFIANSLANQNLGNKKKGINKTPWLKLLTSPVVLACLLNNFAFGLIYSTLTSYIPTYFKEALYLDLTDNGFLSSLPYICFWFATVLSAIVSDALKKRTQISHIIICKVFNTISSVGVAAFVFAFSFMTCTDVGWAIFFLCMANATLSFVVSGFQTSILSIAPAYSGTITAVCRFSGAFASVLGPLLVSALTPDRTVAEWQHVFFLMCSVMLVAGLAFLLFGSVSIQEWAKQMENKEDIQKFAFSAPNNLKHQFDRDMDFGIISDVSFENFRREKF